MEERTSDTEETFGDQDQPAPGQTSNQNAEETGPGGSPGADTAAGDDHPGSASDSAGGSNQREAGRVGGAGEHTQATGNPRNAG